MVFNSMRMREKEISFWTAHLLTSSRTDASEHWFIRYPEIYAKIFPVYLFAVFSIWNIPFWKDNLTF